MLVWAAVPRELVACIALEIAMAVGVAIQLLLGRDILSAITSAGTGATGGTALVDLAPQLVALAAITTLAGFASSALTERRVVLAELVERHVQDRVVDVVTAVDLEELDRPAFYDQLRRARVDAGERSWQVVFGVVSLTNGLAGMVALGAVLVGIQPVVLPLVLLACLPLWLATRRNNAATYAFSFSLTAEDRERAYLQQVLTGRPEAKELRLFGSAGFLRRRYDRIYDRRIAELRRVTHRRMRRSLMANAGSTLATMAGVVVLLQLALSGRVSTADAAVAAVAVQQIGMRLRAVTGSAGQLHECSLFLADLTSFLALGGTGTRPHPGRPAERAGSRVGSCHLAAEDVSYTYPSSARPAIEGVSIEVGEGEVVALVGRNGSGKTTLAKVLCGLYQPSSGRVCRNGIDIATLPAEEAREGVTAIFQDFVHYELPARDNVALSDTSRFDDLEAIRSASRRAGADALLASLPDGYDARLGRAFDGGSELSIGQWQRVALARAFFRDAPLLVLDEPTAALDAEAERDVFNSIRARPQGRSVLLVSHRFSSIRMADRIYVLDRGRLVEWGDHDQLVALGGHYATMFDLQAGASANGRHPAVDRE